MADTKVVTSTADLSPDGALGYTKAIIAAVIAGLGTLGTALADGEITSVEWVGIVAAVVIAGGGVFGFANKVKPVEIVDPLAPAAAPPIDPIVGVVHPPVPPAEQP